MLKDKSTENGQTPPPPGEHKTFVEPPPLDPSRRSGKSGTLALIIVIAILILAGIIGALMWIRHIAAAKKAAAGRVVQPVSVIVDIVKHKDVPIYLDGLGTVQAFNTVTVRARVDGQLKKVAFTEGQDVHAGDLLVEIDPEPFKAQLAQSIAKKAQDQALLNNSRIDLKRETELLAAKIDSQQVYDTQKALVDQYEASVKADDAAIESAQVQLDYATIKSPIDGRTGIRQVDQGNIIHANDTNGVVVITQLKPISIVFTLPEQTLGSLHKNTSEEAFKVVAMDRDNHTSLDEGTLTVIDNQIDTSTGTLKLKATFPNAHLRLWPGQFVNARLLLTTHTNGIVVPAAVIQRGPQGDYAFIVETNNVALMTTNQPPVTRVSFFSAIVRWFGKSSTATPSHSGTNDPSELATVKIRPVTNQIIGADALIESGLTPGERVIIEGQYKLQDGTLVKVSRPKGSAKAPAKTDPAP